MAVYYSWYIPLLLSDCGFAPHLSRLSSCQGSSDDDLPIESSLQRTCTSSISGQLVQSQRSCNTCTANMNSPTLEVHDPLMHRAACNNRAFAKLSPGSCFCPAVRQGTRQQCPGCAPHCRITLFILLDAIIPVLSFVVLIAGELTLERAIALPTLSWRIAHSDALSSLGSHPEFTQHLSSTATRTCKTCTAPPISSHHLSRTSSAIIARLSGISVACIVISFQLPSTRSLLTETDPGSLNGIVSFAAAVCGVCVFRLSDSKIWARAAVCAAQNLRGSEFLASGGPRAQSHGIGVDVKDVLTGWV